MSVDDQLRPSGSEPSEPAFRPWVSGQMVSRYRLITPIASGGMAEIWLAKYSGVQSFEKVVVVKRLLAKVEHDENMVKMFHDEARIASALEHPNIAQVHELGEHEGTYFMAIEYLHGENLSQLARRTHQAGIELPTAHAVAMVVQAAEGLGYAHNKRGPDGQALGIVHRDVSPQNIMVTYEGVVKVVDFGIALAAQRSFHTLTGTVKGKLSYMAPEQAAGSRVDASADVFALGVVLFELLTRSRLYPSSDDMGIMRELLAPHPFPTTRSRNEAVPAELDELVAKAMSRDPMRRFVTARELAAALKRWLHAQPAVPGTVELEALMGTLFADRKAKRQQLMVAEAPDAHRHGTDPFAVSDDSMPGHPTRESQTRARRSPKVLALLAGAAVLVSAPAALAVWALAQRSPAQPPPELATQGVGRPAPLPSPEPAPVAAPVPAPPTPAPQVEPSAPPPRDGVSPAATPKGQARGLLTLETEPWTQVYLGKTLLGDTPLLDLPVPAGTLKLRLVNDEEHVHQVIELEVKPGKRVVKRLKL